MARLVSRFPGTRGVAFALSVLLTPSLALAGPARGAPVQLALLQSMPQDVLARLVAGGEPDASGMVGKNQARWLGAQYQRSAALYLMAAASRGDRAAAEKAWTAIEATFSHEQPDGSFGALDESGAPAATKDVYSDNAFWLADFSQAVLVLRQSPLADAFEDRIHRLIPKVRSAGAFLSQGKDALTLRERETTNRYFIDAVACGLTGEMLRDRLLQEQGAYFADLGLANQQPAGFFLEKGSWDSSYNATSIWHLQIFALYLSDTRCEAALAHAVAWEIGRIGPDGAISVEGNTRTGNGQELYFGEPKEVNYSEAVLGLLYYGELQQDAAVIAAALRAYGYHFQNPSRPGLGCSTPLRRSTSASGFLRQGRTHSGPACWR